MQQKVKDTIAKYRMISESDRVLVGVSGGPDSIALAHVLAGLADDIGFFMHIVHLNHMFRGEEADKDAQSVIEFAAKQNLSCTVEKIDVPAYIEEHRLSAQAGAREVRYSFFEQIMKTGNFNKIATGHHADDQAETVLMNVLRGSGLAGIAGIPPVREDLFIRPLIEVTREEIIQYCEKYNLPVRHDSSNKKDVYLRNRIRNKLFPLLKREYNAKIIETLLRLSEIAREDDDYLTEALDKVWGQIVEVTGARDIVINLSDFLVLHVAIQRRLLMKAWEKVNSSDRDLAFIHVEKLRAFLKDGPDTGWFELPRGIKVRKAYGKARFSPEDRSNIDEYEILLKVPGKTYIPQLGITIITEMLPGYKATRRAGKAVKYFDKEVGLLDPAPGVHYVDYNRLPGDLLVRNRRPGDRFRPLGMKGTKKLKDFFIDMKIPAEEREKYPVIVSGNEVVLVGGLRMDERWKVSKDTVEMLQIKIIHKIEP